MQQPFVQPTPANQAMYGYGSSFYPQVPPYADANYQPYLIPPPASNPDLESGNGKNNAANGGKKGSGKTSASDVDTYDPANLPERDLRKCDALFRRHDEYSSRAHHLNYALILFMALLIGNVAVLYVKKNWREEGGGAALTSPGGGGGSYGSSYGRAQQPAPAAAPDQRILDDHSARETLTTVFLALGSVMLLVWVLFTGVLRGVMPNFGRSLAEEVEAWCAGGSSETKGGNNAPRRIRSVADLKEAIDFAPMVFTSRTLNQIGLWFTVGFLFFQTFFVFFTTLNAVFHHNGESLRCFAGLRQSACANAPKLGSRDLLINTAAVIFVVFATVMALILLRNVTRTGPPSSSEAAKKNGAAAGYDLLEHEKNDAAQDQWVGGSGAVKHLPEGATEKGLNQAVGAEGSEGTTGSKGGVACHLFGVALLCLFAVNFYNLWVHELAAHFFLPLLAGAGALFCLVSAMMNYDSTDEGSLNDEFQSMQNQQRRRRVVFSLMMSLLLTYYMGFLLVCFNLYLTMVERYETLNANAFLYGGGGGTSSRFQGASVQFQVQQPFSQVAGINGGAAPLLGMRPASAGAAGGGGSNYYSGSDSTHTKLVFSVVKRPEFVVQYLLMILFHAISTCVECLIAAHHMNLIDITRELGQISAAAKNYVSGGDGGCGGYGNNKGQGKQYGAQPGAYNKYGSAPQNMLGQANGATVIVSGGGAGPGYGATTTIRI